MSDQAEIPSTGHETASPPPAGRAAVLGEARARLAAGDPASAIRLLEQICGQHGDLSQNYNNAVQALLAEGDPDSADLLLSALSEVFYYNPAFRLARGWLAYQRNDWALADRLWTPVMGLYPADGTRQIVWAELASQQQNWADAADRWALARSLCPDNPICYHGGARALFELHRFDEADALLEDALRRFPGEPVLHRTWAAVADFRDDRTGSAQRWSVARTRFPDDLDIVRHWLKAVRAAGRGQADEVAIGAALARFPDDLDFALAWTDLAIERKDWTEARRRAVAALAKFRDSLTAHRALATILRTLERWEEADAVLTEACRRFPGDRDLAIDHAMTAHNRRDASAAAARWSSLRSRFPDEITGFTFGALELRLSGRWDEADALLREARVRFPGDPQPMIDYARCASEAHNWSETRIRSAELRQHHPDSPAGYILGASGCLHLELFDEADQILAAAAARFPADRQILSEYLQSAQIRHDWPAVLKRAAALRSAFPDAADGYTAAIEAAFQTGERARIDEIMPLAIRHNAASATAMLAHARSAADDGDWANALDRFALVRDRHPEEIEAWTAEARALTALDRAVEADALLNKALARFPEDRDVALAWTDLAVDRKDWNEARRRAAAVLATFGDSLAAYQALATILRTLEDWDEADAVLTEACRRFPGEQALAVDHAMIAHIRRDGAASAARWSNLRSRFPGEIAGFTFGALELRLAGRWDEADALLREARDRFPGDPQPMIDYARCASDAENWPETRIRSADLRRHHPDSPAGYILGTSSCLHVGLFDEADQISTAAAARFPADRQILLDCVRAAKARRDWPAVLIRAVGLREAFPDEAEGYAAAIDAAFQTGDRARIDAIMALAIRHDAAGAQVLLAHARSAADDGDWAAALDRFALARDRHPEEVEAWTAEARALAALDRAHEADALLKAAAERFPQDAAIAAERGWLAWKRDDWPAAAALFAATRASFPDQPAGYLGGAAVLVSQNQHEAADELLQDGMRAVPGDVELAVEYARLWITSKRDIHSLWQEVFRRLGEIRDRFPDAPLPFELSIVYLLERGQIDTAHGLATAAIARFPNHFGVGFQHARVAEAPGESGEKDIMP